MHKGAILIVGIGNPVPAVCHRNQLVDLVVAHGNGNRFSVHAGDGLPGHIPNRIVIMLLAETCGLQEAGKLAQCVIGIVDSSPSGYDMEGLLPYSS